MSVEVILHNARIATNAVPAFAEAIAISEGKMTITGGNEEIPSSTRAGNTSHRRPGMHRHSRTQT